MTTSDDIPLPYGQLERHDELTVTYDDDHYVNVMTSSVGIRSHNGSEATNENCQGGYLEPNDLRRENIKTLMALDNPGEFCTN
jgi:hypothetical protein